MNLRFERKYLILNWGGVPKRYRRWKALHNRRAASIYLQVPLPGSVLEIVVWYWDKKW